MANYIAKVSNPGGTWQVDVWRKGTLDDVPQAEVDDWRRVVVQIPKVDALVETSGAAVISINASGTDVSLAWDVIPFPQQMIAESLKDHAGRVRWASEVKGIMINGVRVATDDVAQRKIAELRRRAEAGEIAMPFEFKSAGGWISLTLPEIQGIDQAVAAHVQACYVVERAVHASIDAGTIATRAAVDGAGWP